MLGRDNWNSSTNLDISHVFNSKQQILTLSKVQTPSAHRRPPLSGTPSIAATKLKFPDISRS